MKKIISFLLIAALLCSLSISVLALSVVPIADKTAVKAGEDVVVTLRFDEAIKAVNTIEVRVYFDDALFEEKDYAALDPNISALVTKPERDSIGTYLRLNYICMAPAGGNVVAGDFCRITFTAKKDITSEQTADFRSRVETLGYANATFGDGTDPVSVSVTVQPAEVCLKAGMAESAELVTGAQYSAELSRFFTDSENHALSYELKDIQPNNNIKIVGGILYFTTSAAGDYSVTVTASCAEGRQAELTFRFAVKAAAAGQDVQYNYNETPADKVTVYVTVSSDGVPLLGKDGTILNHLEVEVPYVDLEEYGLSSYYRYHTAIIDGRHQGSYTDDVVVERPTAMHLFNLLVRKYFDEEVDQVYNMYSESAYRSNHCALEYTGGATSTYMQLFWGHDENLMYYRNHAYPLMSPGWGSTSDYILLNDGDTVDLAMFTDWGFYHHGAFARFDEDAYEVEAGKPLSFRTLKFGTQSVTEGGTDTFEPIEGLNVQILDEHHALADGAEITALGGNEYTLTFAKPGIYYLMGLDPAAGSEDASIAPATAKVVVTEAEPEEPVMLGDVNGDGELDARDLTRLKKYFAGTVQLDEAGLKAADCNGDGELDARDLTRLKKYFAGTAQLGK